MNSFSEDHKEIKSGEMLDKEGYMARVEMDKIEQSLKKLKKVITSPDQQLPAWVQSKITKSSDYLDTVADYLATDVEMSESRGHQHIRDPKVSLPGAVLKSSQSQVAKTSGARALSLDAANQLGPKAKELRKRELQKVQLPKFNEETSLVDKILSEMLEDKPGCKTKKAKSLEDIAKKHKVSVDSLEKQLEKGMDIEMEHTTSKKKARIIALHHLEEIPDYYDRLIKMEREAGVMDEAKKYMSKEDDPCWTHKGYRMFGMKKGRGGKKVPDCRKVEESVTRLPMKTGNLIRVLINWRGRHLFVQMFFPQVGMPRRAEIENEVSKIYPDARVLSYALGQLQSDTPIVQVQEDWQKVNRNDGVDGMSEKAVKKYRQENPGSKLQTAVTEKKPTGKRAERRKSFCRRSKGQQKMHNIDCSKTPDKPICKARRRWRC